MDIHLDRIEYALRVAHHEAGHVVVGAALNCPVESVTILGTHPSVMVRHRKPTFDLDEVRRFIAVRFAGYLAERRLFRGWRALSLQGAETDFAQVRGWDPQRYGGRQTVVRDHFGRAEDWRAFVREQVRMSNRILRNNWGAVADIAATLVDVGTLEGRPLRRMLKRVRHHCLAPSHVLGAMMSAAA